MPDDLVPAGWLFVLIAWATGFGPVRFAIGAMARRDAVVTPIAPDPIASDERSDRPWHELLGVDARALAEQIHAAYRQRLSQYDPDKLTLLGPEFLANAARMTKSINGAYRNGCAFRDPSDPHDPPDPRSASTAPN